MGERRIAVVGVAEGDVVESDARARCGIGSHASRRLGIADGGLGREHLAQALGGHVGAGQHDGHHPHDEAAHDDDHGVGDERDEIAGLHGARGHALSAEPHDGHRGEVHHKHHGGHHEGHGAVGEQLGITQLARGGVEAVLLEALAVEGAHHRQAVQHLAGHEVHAIDERLHDFEPRQREAEQNGDDREDHGHGEHDDPPQLGVGDHDHDHAADGEDGGVEHHAHHHGAHVLDEGDIVGAARDERGRRELVDLGIGEGHHPREQAPAQVAADLGAGAGRHEAGGHIEHHGAGGGEQHEAADAQEIGHLNGEQIDAGRLVARKNVEILHARLGDAHIDDLRGEHRDGQLAAGLQEQKQHNERHRPLVLPEKPDHAQGCPSPTQRRRRAPRKRPRQPRRSTEATWSSRPRAPMPQRPRAGWPPATRPRRTCRGSEGRWPQAPRTPRAG